jgi:hypothetical protein
LIPQAHTRAEGVGGEEDIELTLGRGEVNIILKFSITMSTQRLYNYCTLLFGYALTAVNITSKSLIAVFGEDGAVPHHGHSLENPDSGKARIKGDKNNQKKKGKEPEEKRNKESALYPILHTQDKTKMNRI